MVSPLSRAQVLFIYLYVVLGLFLLHESVVLARYDIAFSRYGFALATALVLAKVTHDGRFQPLPRFRSSVAHLDHRLQGVVYALVFILFYVAEETGGGLLRGDTLRASIPSIAGGTPQGMLAAEVITSLALALFRVQGSR